MTEHTPRTKASWAGWIAAGIFLLIAAGIGVYASNLRNRIEDVELRLVDAVTRMQFAQQQATDAASELAATRNNLGLLTAADVVDMKLTGRPPAPEASARVFISRGSGLLFTASRLPPIADEGVLQLWFLTSSGPVSAGVVRPGEQGAIVAAFDMPNGLATLTGFAVSAERAGGVSEPTGPYLLTTQ